MSGGHFDYKQYEITTIADSIQSIIDKNRVPVEKRHRYGEWDDRKYYYDFPDEVIDKFKEAVKVLRVAHVYAQRVDWLISGDDGDQNFLKRLSDDLQALNETKKV